MDDARNAEISRRRILKTGYQFFSQTRTMG
jgi:hypothetical protein